MAAAATDMNLVWLPTGKLLSVGGATYDHGWILKYGNISHSVRTTQIYDPVAKTWSTGLSMPGTEKRWYHSAAPLLPDGSVLSAGSNNEYNGRIYYPSYFGQTRPAITSAPTTISYGQPFNVGVNMNGLSIEKVTLIRLNATTHGFDQGQRFISCTFTSSVDNLTVTPPANGAVAPPGAYMLFVVATNDRPSHARYVKIG